MPFITDIVNTHRPDLTPYEELYKHFHANPELSFQESNTAKAIANHLDSFSAFTVHTSIGGHGIAAMLQNGPGKTLLLRADMDGLPVEEKTGLPYASTARQKDQDGVEKPVMHACGHDMHITTLLAAAETLVKAKDHWTGTLVLVFQPAEERAGGAQNMVDNGLYDKVAVPDVVIGAHVMAERAGVIGTKRGLMASSADRFSLTIPGRQSHASMPHLSIDPILQAASTILRLQTIVSRQVNPLDMAVVTVSAFHAGDAENIIPSEAVLKIDVRADKEDSRAHILSCVRAIVDAEAKASSNPMSPVLVPTTKFPLLFNDEDVTAALERTFAAHFGKGYDADIARLQGSEDFGILASAVGRPSCFFLYGGCDAEVYDRAQREGKMREVPANHSPFFAPVVQPTLRVGVDGYVVAALTFLGNE